MLLSCDSFKSQLGVLANLTLASLNIGTTVQEGLSHGQENWGEKELSFTELHVRHSASGFHAGQCLPVCRKLITDDAGNVFRQHLRCSRTS